MTVSFGLESLTMSSFYKTDRRYQHLDSRLRDNCRDVKS
jgi:hypothetical protein